MNDVDARVFQLKSIAEKVQVLKVSACLRQQLRELQLEYEQLKSHGDAVFQQLTQSLDDRQALQDSLLAAELWIERKELEIRAARTLPLMSVDAEKKLEDSKVALTELFIVSVYTE